jgi:hypothetical protein
MALLAALVTASGSPALAGPASLCDSTSKALTPMDDVTGFYRDSSLGLYPGQVNFAPPGHDSAGRAMGRSFVALDSSGLPDATGAWVLLSIGMSNTTQEFSYFVSTLAGDTTLHPNLRVVDGAQGGQSANRIKYDTATFWTVIESRLAQSGLSPPQVQAVWLKEAIPSPAGGFPAHALQLRDDLAAIVQIAHSKYPNLKQVFLSSRIYAGYASTGLNPEPYAYESAFSVRWLIQMQLEGDLSLNYIADSGVVRAPWLAWGPYLWADGEIPRPSDSLQWFCSDFQSSDGTHPALGARQKVTALLQKFFRTSPYTAPWFLKPASGSARGDLDGSGAITASDIIALVNIIFKGAPLPNPPGLADVDCSGAPTAGDVIYLVNFVFRAGPDPCQ